VDALREFALGYSNRFMRIGLFASADRTASMGDAMQTGRFTVRTMTRREVDIAIEWAAIEGWNPGRHDADCFVATDPDGFFVGCVDDEPVATLASVRYGASFGFIGLYIVKPGFRGKGYGIRIWNAGLAHLAGRTIGLDGVVEQQASYARCGFALAYRNVRYQGAGLGPGPLPPDVVPASSLPLAAIAAYDRLHFPEPRKEFLACWLAQPESAACALLRNGTIAGYGVVRAAQSGHKIGPLFADDVTAAETLLTTLCEQVPSGTPVYLDVPEVNAAAIAMAGRERMQVVFETARMYTGTTPELPLDHVFGITTFELG
jgi:GNAT superfamily N-acetyltransferase